MANPRAHRRGSLDKLTVVVWPIKTAAPFIFSGSKEKIKSVRALKKLLAAKCPAAIRKEDLMYTARFSTIRRKQFLQENGCDDVLGMGGEGFALWRDGQADVPAEQEECWIITARAGRARVSVENNVAADVGRNRMLRGVDSGLYS